jgi:hypothetical protein
MTKAILAISESAAARLHHPFAGLSYIFAGFWRSLTRHTARHYRPELHYMRGPGPACRAKNGPFPSA